MKSFLHLEPEQSIACLIVLSAIPARKFSMKVAKNNKLTIVISNYFEILLELRRIFSAECSPKNYVATIDDHFNSNIFEVLCGLPWLYFVVDRFEHCD